MYRNLFSNDLFSELDRLQRIAARAFDASPSIRGTFNNRFPAINIGTSPQAVEIYAFAPGIDASKLDIKVENSVLSISGERKESSDKEAKTNLHIGERFEGRFHRVVSLPDDVDSNAITATYRDGVLRIKAPRQEAAQPRRITIQ
ncbi:MAG TPA: Hsp20/alpha crystallin family protein [Steroidobacteraceae bacterium]|jgi:HSP20 family protein|nr:Hsp20/alpha crystallin family protein [Steroidobacteraceae bacterium]